MDVTSEPQVEAGMTQLGPSCESRSCAPLQSEDVPEKSANKQTESPRRATKDLAVSLVELKRRQSVRAFARSMGRADALKMGVAALQF